MKTVLAPLAGAGFAVLVLAGIAAAANPGPASNWAIPEPTAVPAVAPGAASTPSPADTPAPAATPAPTATPAPATTGMIATMLGLTDAQVHELRLQGKSLADIAKAQGVDPQKLVDALAGVWRVRIDARLAAGAITAEQAAALKADVKAQAQAMVDQTAMGGMRGAAVGAGPNGTMRGQMGNGGGTVIRGKMAAGRGGTGMGGRMGAGAGTGTCPATTTTPSS